MEDDAPHIFLLSPARCDGERAAALLRSGATSPIALKLQSPSGVPLGELFTFLSSLYFRGKLTYARMFARPERSLPGVLVIAPGQGLLSETTAITCDALHALSKVQVSADNHAYTRPLARAIEQLAGCCRSDTRFVLLGSIASAKYVDVLLESLGERLLFPTDFVGRGDMSRGGLLLRCAREGRELRYAPVLGAVRRGPRVPKLPKLPRRDAV